MNSYTYVDSPVGRLLMSTDGEALTGIYMDLADGPAIEMRGWACDADAGALPRAAGEHLVGHQPLPRRSLAPPHSVIRLLEMALLLEVPYRQ